MKRLQVSSDGTHLVEDGQFMPLVVDTVWSAFADASEDEWRMYLETRRQQGFTAVLVSALHIPHDRVVRPGSRAAFAPGDGATLDFDRPVPEFFERVRRFTSIAHHEHGIRLMIAVLWNNFLPGTWGAEATPWAVMPDDARRAYVRALAEAVADLEPILVVGGDDHYDVPAANAGYLEAIGILAEAAPGCLLTTHTAPHAVLPDAIASRLDLFLHQSGHNDENRDLTWTQPARYLGRHPRRPLVNSEPPYELHGIVGGHGRWSREDVRRASWTSVLAGASAGIGYGAHGAWMWATGTGEFTAAGPSLEPLPWPHALALPGAQDVALLAWLMRRHRLHRLTPAQQLLADDHGGALRAAASPDGGLIAVYAPYTIPIDLAARLDGYAIEAWDLGARAPIVPRVDARGATARLSQPSVAHDVLVIAERGA